MNTPFFSRDAALRVGLLVGPLAVFVMGLRLAAWQPPRTLDGASGLAVALADGVALGLVGLLVAALLSHLRGWARGVVLAGLYVTVVVASLLAVFQFGYTRVFGLPLDAHVLLAHLNAEDVRSQAPVVAAEFTPLRSLLVAVPALFVLAVVGLMRQRRVRAWAERGETPHARGAVLASVVALVAAGAIGGWGEYARFFWVPPAAPWGPAPEAVRPLFEARDARAVATDSTRRFNVVVVLLESVRAQSTGPWGGPVPTPALDALARRGLVIDEMLAMTPYTNKTVGGLLAGVPPSPRTRLEAVRPGGIPAVGLPDLLRPHGYRSAFMTPALLSFERKDQILANLGFDTAVGAETLGASGGETRLFGVDDPAVLAPALAWVAEQSRQRRPFLLSVLTLAGHYPYDVPDGTPRLGLSEDPLEAAYLDAVAHTDQSLGALVAGLDSLGVMDSTVFVVVGDHGQAFGEHGLFAHGDGLYQEALHVPAIVVAPGLAPGHARGPRQLTDIVPTVLDVLGLRLENGRLPGRSLLAPPEAGRALFFASHHEHVATAWRQGRWKAICRLTCGAMEVYDLARDPGETRDLAATWTAARRDSVGRAMAAWRAGVLAAYERGAE